ncbi:hypothetical protein CC1G_14282 [Coprinopsis cinerea okayama7|uniref:Uncharacterized protein n=1 Tax=Coprinopsis cinerea (strain Okayama-7 / 130 / ATCC MYA-4618 / FGSC 9003) TaxID=240176 RepID=D6RLG4_COPC7|nr:hypothetical protein CC1G_14282 [Coprinopsis cinerea okayama7\|eukprot:XP_002911752.1 hypothetical protein CC1G_14282 [Coprinopsis cinerea okayama7\
MSPVDFESIRPDPPLLSLRLFGFLGDRFCTVNRTVFVFRNGSEEATVIHHRGLGMKIERYT